MPWAGVKDDFKEQADSPRRGPSGFVQWHRLERQSWTAMFNAIEVARDHGTHLIIEGDFRRSNIRALRSILPETNDVREIFCTCAGLTMLRRYVRRGEAPDRHPAHLDRLWYPIITAEAVSTTIGLPWHRPTGLTQRCLIVDTNTGEADGYLNALRFISSE